MTADMEHGVPIDLVTGGSGFIGRHVVAALLRRGANVRVLDLAPPADLAAEVEFVPGSILDPERLGRLALQLQAGHLVDRDEIRARLVRRPSDEKVECRRGAAEA